MFVLAGCVVEQGQTLYGGMIIDRCTKFVLVIFAHYKG